MSKTDSENFPGQGGEPPTTTDTVEAIMAKYHVEVPEPTAWNRFRERTEFGVDKGRNYVEYVSMVDAVEMVAGFERLERMERELAAMITEKRLTLEGARAALGVEDGA